MENHIFRSRNLVFRIFCDYRMMYILHNERGEIRPLKHIVKVKWSFIKWEM
jgi:hypothetical protein